MNKLPIQTFIQLVQLDQSIHNLDTNIKDLQRANSEDKQLIIVHQKANDGLHEHATDAKKQVDAYELQMKDLDTKERGRRALLDQSTNQREYQPLQKEIERLQKAQHDLEETLLQSWNAYETVQREYTEKHKEIETHIGQIDMRIADRMHKIADLEKEHDALEAQRPEYTKDIPEEWLEKYAAMRARVPNPVVELQKDSCGACHVGLRQQDIIDLRKRKLLQCKSCFRFLYIPSDVPEEHVDETA